MRNITRNILIAGAFAFCAAASLTAAKADVVRIALVVAGSQADYDSNASISPVAQELLKKGKGVKTIYMINDPAKLTRGSVSVWDNEADATTATSTAEWKALMGKMKSKSYTIEILEIK
jgi:hypothetical protein